VARSPNFLIVGFISTVGVGFPDSSVFASDLREVKSFKTSKSTELVNRSKFDKSAPAEPLKKNLSSRKEGTPPLELQIRSDSQSYDSLQQRYVARGNASVVIDGALLKADRIEFDKQFQTLFAKGKVRLKKGRQYFQASSLKYNLRSSKGFLTDVYGIIDIKFFGDDLKLLKKISSSPSTDSQKYSDTELSKENHSNSLVNKDTFKENNSEFNIIDNSLSSLKYSCLPLVPGIPEWHQQPLALTFWGGQMTDSEFNEAFFFNGKPRQEYLFGIGLNKRIYQNGPLAFEIELDLLSHNSNKEKGGRYQSTPFAYTDGQHFGEAVIGLGARIWVQPWLNLGFVEGISYTTSMSNYELTKRKKSAKILNYMGFEIEALLTDYLSIVGRLHHRSGAFGLFSGAEEGSNAYLLGFRYRFGSNKDKTIKSRMNYKDECNKLSTNSITNLNLINDGLALIKDDENSLYEQSFLPEKIVLANIDIYKEKLNKNKSNYLEEKTRESFINKIDQNIIDLSLRDSFKIQGSFGLPKSIKEVGGKNNVGYKVAQIDKLNKAKFIAGSVSRWRIQSAAISLHPDGWSSPRVAFTNDPFTPSQTVIEAVGVLAINEKNGDLLIKSKKSRLIFEERLSVPIPKSRRFKQSNEVANKWIFGIDLKDRDGLFVGRQFESIQLFNRFKLSLQPQFLLQRAITGETSSYIKDGESVTSDNVTDSIFGSDIFGLKSKLRGEIYGWDIKIDSNISTFNPERFFNGSRYSGNLNKSIKAPILDTVDFNIFGAYRYKTWNGSLGQTDIYSSYGGFLDKKREFQLGDLANNFNFKIGVGKYQAERFSGLGLIHLWRSDISTTLKSEYPLWTANINQFDSYKQYRYTPKKIIPGLKLNTNISSSVLYYEDGNSQTKITLSGGPSLTYGRFINPYLDYTKLSFSAAFTAKDGKSPFAFDETVDLATLGIGLTQQIAGPLLLSAGFEYNIDKQSQYYGKQVASSIELKWQRRSYDFSFYYKPTEGAGGFIFRLNDFDYKGQGVPFYFN